MAGRARGSNRMLSSIPHPKTGASKLENRVAKLPLMCSFCALLPIRKAMSFFERSLVGKQIHSVHVDSEVTCLMLTDGTQLTIRGWVVVEPGAACHSLELPTLAGGPEGAVRMVKDSRPSA